MSLIKIGKKQLDTNNQKDKEELGEYYEKRLLKLLNKNDKYKFIRTSINNKYELYDYINIEGEKTYLIELRTRINKDKNEKILYEMIHYKKLNRLKQILINNKLIEIIIIFCRVNINNYKDYKFSYFKLNEVNINEFSIYEDINKNIQYYNIPIENLKKFKYNLII